MRPLQTITLTLLPLLTLTTALNVPRPTSTPNFHADATVADPPAGFGCLVSSSSFPRPPSLLLLRFIYLLTGRGTNVRFNSTAKDIAAGVVVVVLEQALPR